MLLRHTTSEIKERTALTVNPAKTCQPIGAMYAALGIHGCLPHSHGSQGCCAYHRSTLSRHYKEPVMAATSSFTEGTSVFGGQSNLLTAIQNIFGIYNPDVIGVHTTCLSETIGDDLVQIIAKAKDEGKVPAGKYLFHVNTPSYIGSHVTGFSNAVMQMVKYFSEKPEAPLDSPKINLIPGWVEPSDMREIKRIAKELGVPITMFPDTSDVLDGAQTGEFKMYPKGGTTIEELLASGGNKLTLALGKSCSEAAAALLEKKCGVPYKVLEVPLGLAGTDSLVQGLSESAGVSVPESIEWERGRLIDMMIDTNQYTAGKRVALWGDPDQLVALTQFLLELDMRPVYIVTGTPGKNFDERMSRLLAGRVPEAKFCQGQSADMYTMHQWIKQEKVDLLIGNTYGKYISRDEDIPFVRYGFPILDRVSHQYFASVGYVGAMHLLDKILHELQSKFDREVPEEKFELVL